MKSFAEMKQSDDQEADIAHWIQDREGRYEHSMVKQVLKVCGLEDRQYEIMEANEQATGEKRLTFAWFHNLFARFPVRMAARHLPDCSKQLLVDCHNASIKDGKLRDRFFSSLLFRTYEKVREEFGAGDTVALIFPCKTIPNYVLHNGDPRLSEPGSRLCKTDQSGTIYTIEPLGQFVRQAHTLWEGA